MKIDATAAEAAAILRAMTTVASCGGTLDLTDTDRATLVAAGHYCFALDDPIDFTVLAGITPNELASALAKADLRDDAACFLGVMPFVDGVVDKDKVALAESYAEALGIDDDFLVDMREAALGHLRWVGMDMVRHNMLSITHKMWGEEEVMPWLLPYKGEAQDPGLAARFHDLEKLPPGSLGHEFWHHYTRHGFAFPGEENALNAIFAVPHDTTHLLSDYSTSYAGEILVSTFTAGMHPVEPMSGHILPVIFSWHLGIQLLEAPGSHKGALDPVHFWEAWTRGKGMQVDVFAPEWDFWANIHRSVDDLKAGYGVPPKET
jgi:hypothetical protein